MEHKKIVIKGLKQNNLKNISLDIPKQKIVVFTGVSGSGKSFLIRDVFAKQYAQAWEQVFPEYSSAAGWWKISPLN